MRKETMQLGAAFNKAAKNGAASCELYRLLQLYVDALTSEMKDLESRCAEHHEIVEAAHLLNSEESLGLKIIYAREQIEKSNVLHIKGEIK